MAKTATVSRTEIRRQARTHRRAVQARPSFVRRVIAEEIAAALPETAVKVVRRYSREVSASLEVVPVSHGSLVSYRDPEDFRADWETLFDTTAQAVDWVEAAWFGRGAVVEVLESESGWTPDSWPNYSETYTPVGGKPTVVHRREVPPLTEEEIAREEA